MIGRRLRVVSACCLSAALFLAPLAGCSQLNFDKFGFDLTQNIPWGAGSDGTFQTPMKVVAVWTDTVLTQGMAPSTRGFGGRLMFYAADGGKPVKVRGTLMVYAFDETGRDIAPTKPDRKFVFTPEQFEKHYSKSGLGHSYSVWLPWDGAGGPFREISLIIRFLPENGPTVVGDASKQHLPGQRTSDPTQYVQPVAATATPNALALVGAGPEQNVQLVNYETAAAAPALTTGAAPPATSDSSSARRMTTTTIALPTHPNARRQSALSQAVTMGGSIIPPTVWQQQHSIPAAAPQQPFTAPAASYQAQPATLPSPGDSGQYSPAQNSPAAGQAGMGLPAFAASSTPSAHYGQPRLRPLGAPLARLERDHAPWQQPRIESQSAPPFARQ